MREFPLLRGVLLGCAAGAALQRGARVVQNRSQQAAPKHFLSIACCKLYGLRDTSVMVARGSQE
jgi:hypothetical protein